MGSSPGENSVNLVNHSMEGIGLIKNQKILMIEKASDAPDQTSSNSRWARRQRAIALASWISNHPFQLAVTITFKRSIQGRPPSFEAARKIARRVIIDLERSIFGNLTRRKGLRLSRATFLGKGLHNDNPHIHMAIQKPQRMDIHELEKRIASLLRRERLIGKCQIKRIWSEGWIDYMTHHGIEAFDPKLSSFEPHPEG
jgi:hypothetical protein